MKQLTLDKRARRIAGSAMMIDGLSTVLLGRTYVRFWKFGPDDHPYARALRWLADRPPWLLRVAGLLETSVGIGLLGATPLSVRELYGATAGMYKKIEVVWRDWLYAEGHRAFDRATMTHLPPDGDVLDLGCGTGANLARIRELDQPFGSYTGVDLSEAMLTQARSKLTGDENIHFVQLNLETDPLPEGSFDLVISTWVMEHLANPNEVVRKAWERLRPGGHMVLFFEIATGFWWGQIVDRILRFLSARRVPQNVYQEFPGLVTANRYRGLFGDVALIILHKPRQ